MAAPLATLDYLREFLRLGLSLIVATRDATMVPTLSRVGGARLGADGLLRFLVAIPEGERTLANVDATGAVAFSCVRPTTYQTFQVKGYDAHRVEWPELDDVARSHRALFRKEIEALGIPETVSELLWSRTFVAIAFTPVEIFEQTPGPTAGLALIA